MLRAQYWERSLLHMAHEALDSEPHNPAGALDHGLELAEAYRTCEAITSRSSKTFSMAAALLPAHKRRAAQALYAFCRVSDDLVDRPEAGSQPQELSARLETWRQQAVQDVSPAGATLQERQVSVAWAEARCNFSIPRGYANQLIDGLALDLGRARYETFDDLARYCYGVACTVGLMSMHITGYSGREAIPYAIRLGVALQLTNILRDVGEDWRAGRLYLPAEELAAYGLDAGDIAVGVNEGRYDRRWRAFMAFQVQRARDLYAEALPGVGMLHPDGRFAIAAAGELYRAILDKIEANDYEVFRTRASVGGWGKLRRLPGIWLRSAALA